MLNIIIVIMILIFSARCLNTKTVGDILRYDDDKKPTRTDKQNVDYSLPIPTDDIVTVERRTIVYFIKLTFKGLGMTIRVIGDTIGGLSLYTP